MTILTIITTVVFYVSLAAIIWLLWRGQNYTQKMQHTLLDLANKSQETAKSASEATARLTAFLSAQEAKQIHDRSD